MSMIGNNIYLKKIVKDEVDLGVIFIGKDYVQPKENECAMIFLCKQERSEGNILLVPCSTYQITVDNNFNQVLITPKEITKTTILRTLNTRDTFRDVHIATYNKIKSEDSMYLAIINLSLDDIGISIESISINLDNMNTTMQ